jgi:hypothetical protein
MLQDKDLVEKIYEHPMILALRKPEKGEKERRLPSYISDSRFALVLFDVLVTAGTEKSVIQKAIRSWKKKLEDLPELKDEAKRKVVLKAVDEALHGLEADIENISGDPQFADKFNARLVAEVMELKSTLTTRYPFLEPIIDELPQHLNSQRVLKGIATYMEHRPQTGKLLNSLMTEAISLTGEGEARLAAFRTGVETLFNDTMDRLTGWYKRRAQLAAFIIGIGFSFLLNIDSLAVITTLYREPTVRSAVVANAEALQELPETDEGPRVTIETVNEQLEELRLPVGWMKLEPQRCDEIKGGLSRWVGPGCIVPADAAPQGIPYGASYVVGKLVGWLLSGLAATQGAPFWFEVLKRLVNIRSSGEKPDEKK